MDAISRGRRLLLTFAVAAAASAYGGCSGRNAAPVGFSPERAQEKTARSSDAGVALAEPSPVPADFRSRMVRLKDRFVSEGHAERFDAIVWGDEATRAAWGATGDMPNGSMFVEELIERDRRGDRPAGLLVMKKDGAEWRFTAVGPAGEVVSDARVAPCSACHRDAPRDDVY